MTQYIVFFIAALCILPLHADEELTHNTSYTNRFYQHQNPYVEPRATLAVYEKRPQDKAKEQFRASCSALNRLQQLRSPSYPIQNINARLFASWNATDFAHAAESAKYEAIKHGNCRHHVEQQMLRRYDFYSVLAFREYIKTIAGYRSHIKKLHARLQAQKSRLHRVWRTFGFSDPNYIQQLDMAERLNAEILKEEAIEQAVAKQQQRLEALEAQQRILQAQYEIRNQQESVRKAFESQRKELNRLPDEWSCLQDMYQEHDLCDGGRYEQRRQALYDVIHDACNYETKSYPVSSAASELIGNTGNDAEPYRTCYGNQLQQVIHQECIDGMERLVSLPETSVVYPYKESIAQCFDAAREYNQAGSVDKATAVADFCWTLLDYGKAIAQGAIDGFVGGVCDMLEHPVETVLCAVACKYVLAYQASKILYNVADIGITYAFDADRGKQQWDEYVAPVTQLIDAISNKELSLRDGLQGVTQFAVQWKTQAKLLGGLNKFCKTAKAKALQFAKNNPLALPEQYMTTPEGILLQSTNNIQSPASGSRLIKYTSSSKHFVANEQEIVELASKNYSLMQPDQNTLQTIGTGLLNTPEEFFKHIFSAELVEKTFLTGKTKKNVAGFHHHLAEHLDEMRIKLLNVRICNKTELIISDVLCDGHLEADKTFFPSSWSREKVISKIAEALKNLTDSPRIEGSKGILLGQTSEGIIVKVVVDIKSGNYVTAYPDARANGLLSKV
ncbi:EndoU domain-containing protein [Candidatus Dependentiae bacterium]|nr:EndoU domain-containing protein [Candidatus Dependentiae bacterium]MCC7414954.1 EndoU domain-containing protein [Campylobacterota bacterium]